jgi:uncharacterized protein YbjT (DUF2867 family)
MKIIVTGSLGRISKPLTDELVQKGHAVTVISSDPAKKTTIEALGATAAIGSVKDVDFLTAAFTGADAVYTMVPPGNYFDKQFDVAAHCQLLANNYAQAIEQSGVKRVVHLSSIGAHLTKGSGLIVLHHHVELVLGQLADVAITFMRPVGFYYNLYSFVPVIKNMGMIAANYGGNVELVWVSPIDIAAAIAEELQSSHPGHNVRYVASDELSGNETARILGEAIGIPDLKWVVIPNEQMQAGLEGAGMQPDIAAGLVEMFAAQQTGLLMEDYYCHKPVLGKVKLTDFAKEFALVFNQK